MIDSESFSDLLACKRVVFCGNGAGKCKELIRSDKALFLDDCIALAEQMTRLSFEKMLIYEKTGEGAEDVAYFTPFYLKEFQAAPSHVKGLR